MVVISDTSAITNLLQIGQLDLLRLLYGKILISPSVQRELYQYADQSEQIEKLVWIEVKYPENQKLVQKMLKDLDLGESESIALALQENADFLIIDEQLGRKIANSLNLKVVGILGVLILAKKRGLLIEIRTSLESLIKIGFRLNQNLINSVLKQLGEAEI